MMRTVTMLLFSAAILAEYSCTKATGSSSSTLPGNVTAYIAGTAGDTAVYFVNGKEYPLTSGTNPASAKAIVLSGTDVYVAGYESNGTHLVAKYWKNGTAVVLSDTTTNATANAIATLGSDIYVAGRVTSGNTTSAVLWKNGTPTVLNATGHSGGANGLFISGTDVYVAGYDSTASQTTACYWKNGVITTLPDSLAYAVAQAITLNGSDVYVAGWDRSPDGFSFIGPRCWKNGTNQTLATSSASVTTTAITVATNTVFLTGQDNGTVVYWQNGAENILSNGVLGTAIAINNGDIYVAGVSDNLVGSFGTAVFWRDGVIIPLSANAGTANAMVIAD